MTEEATVQADRRYASRKFIFACVVWFSGTVAWLAGSYLFKTPMTTDQWIVFSEWILGLYMAGNVGDSFAGTVPKK